MNALCHKLLAKLHISKHTTLVESCSEEFLPIMSPINKRDQQRQPLEELYRQMPFKETSPPLRAEPTSCEQAQQQQWQPTHHHSTTIASHNGNQQHYCGDHTTRGHNTAGHNNGAATAAAAATTNRWSSSSSSTPSKKNLQEFDFTLYDLNGHGRATKDDIAGLVRSIYERIGSKIDLPRGGARRIRVKLELDDRSLTVNEMIANEIVRAQHRSSIRVAFDEEQLLYETIKQQQQHQHQQMTDLRSSQKCNHHSHSGNAQTRTAKKVPTSEALRQRHSVPISTPLTFTYNGAHTHRNHHHGQSIGAYVSPISGSSPTPRVTSHAVYATVGAPPLAATTAVNSGIDAASTAAVVEHAQVGGHLGSILKGGSPYSAHGKGQHHVSSRRQHHSRRRRQLAEKTERADVAREKPDRTQDCGRVREKFVLKCPFDEETSLPSKGRHGSQQFVRHVHHHYHHIA